nr:NADH dehydrogenase subunit 2 [Musculium lacustre]
MVLTPSFVLFAMMLVFGTAVVFMSSSIVGVWLGLELNFLGVIPLMIGKSVLEGEGVMKYFLVQAVGASLLIMGGGLSIGGVWDNSSLAVLVFTVFAVLLKIGIFPFCFWVPSVLGLISWFNCFIVMVWQKLGLIWFLSGLSFNTNSLKLLEILVVMTSFVGGLGGLGVYHYRVLAAYSSLVHVGWMIMIGVVSSLAFIMYWSLYFFIMGGFVLWFYYYGINSFSDFIYLKGSFIEKLSGGVYFFSLAGLPPFSGVFLKIMGIIILLNSFPFVLFFLMVCSALSLFYYSKVFAVLSLSNFMHLGLWKETNFKNLSVILFSFILNCFLGVGILALFSFF